MAQETIIRSEERSIMGLLMVFLGLVVVAIFFASFYVSGYRNNHSMNAKNADLVQVQVAVPNSLRDSFFLVSGQMEKVMQTMKDLGELEEDDLPILREQIILLNERISEFDGKIGEIPSASPALETTPNAL